MTATETTTIPAEPVKTYRLTREDYPPVLAILSATRTS